MRQLEVRYCDAPRKLLGWVQVPDSAMVLGRVLKVLDMSKLNEAVHDGARSVEDLPAVEFKVVSQFSGFGSTYLALKADGHPPERVAWLLRTYDFTMAR